MAAVSVVLPWSMWPIVPTLRCGFDRSNFCFAMCLLPLSCGSGGRTRTADNSIMSRVLCQLSYAARRAVDRSVLRACQLTSHPAVAHPRSAGRPGTAPGRLGVREPPVGIEPTTPALPWLCSAD